MSDPPRLHGEITGLSDVVRRAERRRCANIARGTAAYWREFSELHKDDSKMVLTYTAARARAEVADQIASEIEDVK